VIKNEIYITLDWKQNFA